jgi:hypothetical protein
VIRKSPLMTGVGSTDIADSRIVSDNGGSLTFGPGSSRSADAGCSKPEVTHNPGDFSDADSGAPSYRRI